MQHLRFFARFFAKNSRVVGRHFHTSHTFHSICLIIVLVGAPMDVGFGKEKVEKVELDTVVKDFTLQNPDGTAHALYKLNKEKSATVVLFLATQCPIATDYAERIVALIKAYEAQNVQFIGINSNKQEKVEEISEYSEKHGFEFPVLKDPENKIADYFGARRTPEVFLLDPERILRYAGAIDNSPKAPTKNYLQDALDLIIAGKEIPKTSKKTRAVGCTIKRVRKTDVDRTP